MRRRDFIPLGGLFAASAAAATPVGLLSPRLGGKMAQADMDTLQAEVRLLKDKEDIRRLRMLYHLFINEGTLDRAPEIYTEDAYVEWSTAGKATGHREILALFQVLPAQSRFVKHFVSNHIVDIDGDVATGSAYVDARYATDTTSELIAAKYDERYRRTSAGWKISETILTVYFKAALPGGWAEQVKRFDQFRQ